MTKLAQKAADRVGQLGIRTNGVNMAHFSGRLLEKVEELTLYTLEQEDRISAQDDVIAALYSEIEALKTFVIQD